MPREYTPGRAFVDQQSRKYPPAITSLLIVKRKDFSQLEDFNANRGADAKAKAAKYQTEHMARMSSGSGGLAIRPRNADFRVPGWCPRIMGPLLSHTTQNQRREVIRKRNGERAAGVDAAHVRHGQNTARWTINNEGIERSSEKSAENARMFPFSTLFRPR